MLKRLVQGIPTAEVQKIDGRPDLARRSLAYAVKDELLEVAHVRYLYTNFGQRAS